MPATVPADECAPSPLARLAAGLVTGLAWLLTGARARWVDGEPAGGQCIYVANHTSHLDFVLLWAALPAALRWRTRPVAAADYWGRTALRRALIHRVFHGVLVDRSGSHEHGDPLAPILRALDEGRSLILFPEGRRNEGEEALLPFRSGIYRLILARPHIHVVPVWIRNVNRVMPRGRMVPLPVLCALSFGAPLALWSGETKEDFLGRLRSDLLRLRGEE